MYAEVPVNRAIHILIIDSDADMLKACEQLLRSRKTITVTTCDNLAAMRILFSCMPDIVLIELVMPDKDGIELLREIKRTAPETKIIAMSGGGDFLSTEFVLRLARRLGADSTVSKPVDAGRLHDAIETVFPSQAAR